MVVVNMKQPSPVYILLGLMQNRQRYGCSEEQQIEAEKDVHRGGLLHVHHHHLLRICAVSLASHR